MQSTASSRTDTHRQKRAVEMSKMSELLAESERIALDPNVQTYDTFAEFLAEIREEMRSEI